MLVGRKQQYEVYFDRLSLRSGDVWDEKIIDQINQSDLFIYLISPDSIAPDNFCHNELAVAKKKWPSPKGHILAVEIVPTDAKQIDPYVLSVKYENPKGDPAAATAWFADNMIADLKGCVFPGWRPTSPQPSSMVGTRRNSPPSN